MKNIKIRLALLSFLQFAIWGAYLTSLGSLLYSSGLQDHIGIFYAIQGIVSIFMPALVGIVADRWIQAQKMLSLCQLVAGGFMCLAGVYGANAMAADGAISFGPLFTLYTLSVAFYMPTIGLSNAVGYSVLNHAGLDTVKHFPPIRTLGTVGFICSMLFINFAGLQNSPNQLVVSGILSFVLALYSLTMPKCPTNQTGKKASLVDAFGLRAFTLFKNRQMALFFIFSMLLGVALQITNGFANPFIQNFGDVAEFAGDWGVRNANALISLSQASETFCILLIPFFLHRYGIKTVMLLAMGAWVLRFGLFGIGNTGSGVIWLILSMIVYGIAFDFFNVSGSLFVDTHTDNSIRSSAQGLFMVMTNGIGATIGTLGAQAVINNFVFSQPQGMPRIDGWHTAWFIFAGYALVVGLLFFFTFRYKHNPGEGSQPVKTNAVESPADGFTDII